MQSGGTGGLTSVFMRGTNSGHVKILIDGIDVSDPSSPSRGFDLGHLATADVSGSRFAWAPERALWGRRSGRRDLRHHQEGRGAAQSHRIPVEGASFGTFNQAVGASGSQGRFNYALNVSHLRSTDIPVTPSDLLPPGQKRNNDFYDNWTYSTRLGVDVSQALTLNMVARYTDARLTLRGTTSPFFLSPLRRCKASSWSNNSSRAARPSGRPFGDVFQTISVWPTRTTRG